MKKHNNNNKSILKFNHIIFDLDGTISDPTIGIRNSLEYSVRKMGINFDISSRFNEFIGPPLHIGIGSIMGLSENDTEKAVKYFREYYAKAGLYENITYPGIKELFDKLKERKAEIYIATSKYEKYALKVIDNHGLSEHITFLAGADYKGSGAEKESLIKRVIDKIIDEDRKNIVMIGDRSFDILAAKRMQISAVAVLYGFGTEEELSEAGADYIVRNVQELSDLLIS
ncbi:MAG: HAD hydrolase-like protein [Bacteroidales bacterium]|nr:HAD hydrolase-like protein [Bacteroidales bacterium]